MDIIRDSKNLFYLQTEYENIPILVSYDQYKTVRFKIRPDFRVEVFTPQGISQKKLLELMVKRQDWIVQSLEDKEKKLLASKEYALENSKKFRYLSRDFVIEVRKLNQQKHKICFNQAKILVYLVNPESLNELKIVLNTFSAEKLKSLTRKYYYKYAPYFLAKNVASPIFTIKKLHRTWGIFKRRNNQILISLNYKLIEFSPKCIEYVVLHELCHALQANHSKKYWDIVAELMPDHKKYNNIFKEKDS